MKQLIKDMICISRKEGRIWQSSDALAKLLEEGGEFSTASQIKSGKMKHKQMKHDEEDFEECADVIMCAIDTLALTNKEMNSRELIEKLEKWIVIKNRKWNGIKYE